MTAKRRWLIVLLGVPFLLLLLIAAASWFGARYALETYTALQPRPLPVTKLDALADADLRRKLDVFSESYEAGQPASLELTAPELNARAFFTSKSK